MKACVLGATGCIGIELVAALLRRRREGDDVDVVCVVRDKAKLSRGLKARGLELDGLTIREGDLFRPGESFLEDILLPNEQAFDVIVNCASPRLSWIPFSSTNTNWGSPVSDLTSKIMSVVVRREDAAAAPRIVAFCGPEYFDEYDPTEQLSSCFRCLSWLSRALYPALEDNAEEVHMLLNSNYSGGWTIFRCGSTLSTDPDPAIVGDLSKIGSHLHKDESNYSLLQGYSLRACDLGAFVAESILSKNADHLNEMPFVWNTSV